MNINSMCSNPEVLSVFRIIIIVIKSIKIAVPIILMVVLMFKLTKAIYLSNDKEIEKVKSSIPKNIISAVCIFLVPTILNVLLQVLDISGNYKKCYSSSNFETINQIYISKSEELIEKANESLERVDYIEAYDNIEKITDNEEKEELIKELEDIYDKIEEKEEKIREEKEKQKLEEKKELEELKKEQEEKRIEEEQKEKEQPNNPTQNVNKTYGGNIYMGDSRTVGLQMYSGMFNSYEQIIAKSSANINNYYSDVETLKQILNNNSSYYYNIILNYGVNDLGSDYCSAYSNLSKNIDSRNKLLIVSVNPVNDSTSKYVRNARIETFNNNMKNCMSSINNSKYCDVYNSTSISNWVNNYVDSSGIHYTSSGYKYIYTQIKNCL